ncbi:MAG: hypothetical protein MHMPM18_001872 [Marteilia pararefringens]
MSEMSSEIENLKATIKRLQKIISDQDDELNQTKFELRRAQSRLVVKEHDFNGTIDIIFNQANELRQAHEKINSLNQIILELQSDEYDEDNQNSERRRRRERFNNGHSESSEI